MTVDKRTSRWNFGVLLGQGVFRNVGMELSSEKLVLPFLYTALGGPVLYAGLLVPVVTIARLVAQLLGAQVIATARTDKWYLLAAMTFAALALVGISLWAGDIPFTWLPVAFLAAATVIGACLGFGALSFQDMLGRVLIADVRSRLLFTVGAVTGALTVATALLSQLVTGLDPDAQAWRDHIHLLWAGAGMMLLSSLAVAAVREPPKTRPVRARGQAEIPEPRGYAAALIGGMRVASRLPWFRKFVVARLLFLSVEIVIPFFAVHAAIFHAQTALSLSLFVISSSIGMVLGGLVWPRVGKVSIQLVLLASAGAACVAAMIALASHLEPSLQSHLTHAVMIVLLAFAGQGVVNANTVYVVGAAGDDERPYCIAAANFAAGLGGIGVALAMGSIAHHTGVIWALMAMAGLNIAAAVYARTLPDIGQDQTPSDGNAQSSALRQAPSQR